MRKNGLIFLLVLFLFFALVGCGETSGNNSDIIEEERTEIREIYELALKSGYTGTYEDWLESVKGESVVLQVSNGYIQWKYSGSTNWSNLISLTELAGASGADGKTPEFRVDDDFIKWRYAGENDLSWRMLMEISTLTGADGKDGKTPEFRVNSGFIEWRYTGEEYWKQMFDLSSCNGENGLTPEFKTTDTYVMWKYTVESDSEWKELLSLDDLKGEQGEPGQPGENGKTPELRVNDGYIEYRYSDAEEWEQLVELSTLIGPKGDQGEPGQNGTDGRTPELRVNEGYVEWRYIGSEAWKPLIELSTLIGEKGDQGEPGQPGENGKTPELRVNDGYIEWRYVGEEIWKPLVELSTLIGPKGDQGETGEDGRTPIFREHEGYLQWKYANEDDTAWRNIYEIPTIPDNIVVRETVVITFDYGDGYTEEVIINKGENIPEPTELVKENYEFLGWYLGDKVWEFDFYITTKNITLTAKWKKTAMTVIYLDADSTVIDTEYIPFNSYYNIRDYEVLNEYYVFDGWERTLGENIDIVQAGYGIYFTESIMDAMVLKAIVRERVNVIYKNEDDVVHAVYVCLGDTISLPKIKLTKDGYAHIGWKVEVSNEDIVDNEFEITQEIIDEFDDLIVVPIWGEVTNANGVYSFVASSYEERTKILGILEKYAYENFLTGFTLYEEVFESLEYSSTRLNINSCTPEFWEQLFGENGSIIKTDKDNYWDVEPAMSNKDFLYGLSFALDRASLADSLGKIESVNFFNDGYLSDPDNGVIYNTTGAHQNAISKITGGGQYPDGYNLEWAQLCFRWACDTFINEGIYQFGDTITIEIAWQSEFQFAVLGDPIIQMWQDAFNEVGEAYGLTLEVTNWASDNWSDVYYEKMMKGQFDIGCGSISGNKLNPLNFMEVLKSDNSSGFTLSWGVDTSLVNIEYKGLLWSFDSLWQVANTGGYFVDGQVVDAFAPEMKSEDDAYAEDCYTENEDGTVTIKIDVNPLLGIDGLEVDVEKVTLCGYNTSNFSLTYQCGVQYNKETGELVLIVSKEAAENLFGDNNYYYDVDREHWVLFEIQFYNIYNEVAVTEYAEVEFAPEWMY